MDITDILSVGLTAEDFDICLEGLDAIPEKGMIQEMATDLFKGALIGNNEFMRQEHLRRVEAKTKEMQRKMQGRQEDLVILKSKLILLKRLLISNEAVKMANEILKSPLPQK